MDYFSTVWVGSTASFEGGNRYQFGKRIAIKKQP
jgi:hypothetical protein